LSIAVAVSAVVSLTLTPMMCSRLLVEQSEEKQSRFFVITEGFFAHVEFLRPLSAMGFAPSKFTLAVAAVTLVATVLLTFLCRKDCCRNRTRA